MIMNVVKSIIRSRLLFVRIRPNTVHNYTPLVGDYSLHCNNVSINMQDKRSGLLGVMAMGVCSYNRGRGVHPLGGVNISLLIMF